MKVLVANRGVIACRIFRTLQQLGIPGVAVYSEADKHARHVSMAGEAVELGPASAARSYLAVDKLLAAARSTGATAIHPGYGFLSENADFAEACEKAGITFIGPTAEQMRAFGLKHRAREVAVANNVPLLPGTPLLADAEEACREATRIGFPVMLKSTAGGGGIGMRVCASEAELRDNFASIEALSKANFSQGGLYLEKFIARARHIEVQIFGDGRGEVLALGERECSAQRRNQKVLEETPAPGLSAATRERLLDCAVRMGRAVQYRNAGTVEFLYDDNADQFYFLEVNTRLQVEHGVTEEAFGVDLVAWMLHLAAGTLPPLSSLVLSPKLCSIQARIYAENPALNFQPSSGLLMHVAFPDNVRVESWVESGTEVTPFYDPLLAKIIANGSTREEALARLDDALAHTSLAGIVTNTDYLRSVIALPEFAAGRYSTSLLNEFRFAPRAIEVIDGGTQSTVQDYPGRIGYWEIGVPPSGPMDALAFRLANRIVGNIDGAAGFEFTVSGPALRFHTATSIAITGADMKPQVDGKSVPLWQPIAVAAGSTLQLSMASGGGQRCYLAVAGGVAVPEWLGSRSTFILGKFGGHGGRVLQTGDFVPLAASVAGTARPLPASLQPQMPAADAAWEIGVLYGPHGAPDFFTTEDIDTFFAEEWEVHYHSDRTGVRLIGPKPKWARKDGGEAGLHPSNLHDNAYAIGSVDFTGDMPILLGPDGPSLGGFVCPAVIAQAELWKMGQLKPGDRVRFRALTLPQARALEDQLEAALDAWSGALPLLPSDATCEPAIAETRGDRVSRSAGDAHLLIEYGPMALDFGLRLRVHQTTEALRAANIKGIIDLTPGVRSLQVHYNPRQLSREDLLSTLSHLEASLPSAENAVIDSRIVHLPLSWDDPQTQLAIQRYQQGVRPDAPWCPSNIEFIRRINGLASHDDVHRIVFDASYVVLGLGDVYLGAPVATPLDPRHRLVTTKYNPARTWTPENAVGIGGAYMCIYGMEGPGGYQFVGRTVQVWNTFRRTAEFQPGVPWLLRFFDQIRFYPVSADELLSIREEFPHGRYPLRMEATQFRMADYQQYLQSIAPGAAAFKQTQQQAFEAERERWAAAGLDQDKYSLVAPAPMRTAEAVLPPGCHAVRSPIAASVWSNDLDTGQAVTAGDRLVVLEAMKMAVNVASPVAGRIVSVHCTPGDVVRAGQLLAVVEEIA
jgi:urea carboxylase